MTGAGDAKEQGAHEHRKIQSEKQLNPHMANTNSAMANEMPFVGAHNPPPELISSIDLNYTPKDSVPQNTENLTSQTQKLGPQDGPDSRIPVAGLGVGEIEGGKFKIEPLRRTGEDCNTMRARLLCSFLL
jgi:hypothetical protein